MKTIYLIRHCKAHGQEREAALTPEGIQQSQSLANFLAGKGVAAIISSPYLRAVQTIQPFSERTGLPIHVDHRLVERTLSAENLTDWLEKLKQTFDDMDLKLEGGESSAEAANRGIAVIRDLWEASDKTVAIVSHGNLLSLMIRTYNPGFGFKDWKEMSNPDVYELSLDREEAIIRRIWN